MDADQERIVERLALAQEVVNRSGVEEALKPVAFAEAYRTLSGVREERSVVRRTDLPDHDAQENLRGDTSERLASVAEALGVGADMASQLFAESDGDLLFVLPPRRLSNSTRGAMRQIAILMVCARQAGHWDDAWTTVATLRSTCQAAQVYSSKHFSDVMAGLDMFAVQGSGGNRQFRAHAGSYEGARSVLAELGLLAEHA